MHSVRLCDFYAHAAQVDLSSGVRAWGPPLEIPAPGDCARVVALARPVVEAAIAFARARAEGDGR